MHLHTVGALCVQRVLELRFSREQVLVTQGGKGLGKEPGGIPITTTEDLRAPEEAGTRVNHSSQDWAGGGGPETVVGKCGRGVLQSRGSMDTRPG